MSGSDTLFGEAKREKIRNKWKGRNNIFAVMRLSDKNSIFQEALMDVM